MALRQFDIVRVTRKTRAKFKDLEKALKDDVYMITSMYTPSTTWKSFGVPTTKLFLIDKNNKKFFTTDTCVERVCNLYDYAIDPSLYSDWIQSKKKWMEEEYVPVMVQHKYNNAGFPMIASRDNQAYLVKPIHNENNFWINVSQIHDDDIKLFTTSSFPVDREKKDMPAEAVTVRVPLWFAKGKGLFD